LAYVKNGNFTFLQIAIGYILGRLAIVAWLLPGYFRGEMLSAYQVLEQRFGVTTRRLASLVFLVMRNLADGLRLFLTALALNIALGLDLLTCILVTSVATAIYSCVGGVRSVVWNDCIQFAVYILGAIAAAFLLLEQIPGGWSQSGIPVKPPRISPLTDLSSRSRTLRSGRARLAGRSWRWQRTAPIN
jgi:Na+/proline symporter